MISEGQHKISVVKVKRKQVYDSRSEYIKNVRLRVLRGNFLNTEANLEDNNGIPITIFEWLPPSMKEMIFVSSTFTDTQCERDVLLKNVLPRLCARGRGHGIEVVFVDMRFGVKNENTLDHCTWSACRTELERCRSSSMGIFFMSLQSEK